MQVWTADVDLEQEAITRKSDRGIVTPFGKVRRAFS